MVYSVDETAVNAQTAAQCQNVSCEIGLIVEALVTDMYTQESYNATPEKRLS